MQRWGGLVCSCATDCHARCPPCPLVHLSDKQLPIIWLSAQWRAPFQDQGRMDGGHGYPRGRVFAASEAANRNGEHPNLVHFQSLPRPRSRVSSRLPLQWAQRPTTTCLLACLHANPPSTHASPPSFRPQPQSPGARQLVLSFRALGLRSRGPAAVNTTRTLSLSRRGRLLHVASRSVVHSLHHACNAPQHHALGFSAHPAPAPAPPNPPRHLPKGMGYRRHAALFNCLVLHVAQLPRTAAD
jgi:hypothetical protein